MTRVRSHDADRPPRVAVVIASRDRPAMLREALAAVAEGAGPGDEVVVVDSASRTAETLEIAHRAGVRGVRCELPGLARARNAGVAATSADIVAFTDDDCLPDAGWVEATRRAFAGPEIGFVAGRVLPVDRTDGFTVSVKDATERRHFSADADAATVGHGANFAARREVIIAVGGFDELLGAGGRFRAAEDYDFFHRALRAGWLGLFEPTSVVGHRQWRGRWDAVKLQYGYGLGAGAFAVKTIKASPREGTAVLLGQLWTHGALPLSHDLRNRYKTGIAMGVLRLAGTVVGSVRAVPLPVSGGRFES